jgi:hypothetical protein
MTKPTNRPPKEDGVSDDTLLLSHCPTCGDPGECVPFGPKWSGKDILSPEDIKTLEAEWALGDRDAPGGGE